MSKGGVLKTAVRQASLDVPRLRGLDALRGLAGLSVVVFHAFLINPTRHGWWMRFVGQGAEGVGLFFILSALTLGMSWDYRRQQYGAPPSSTEFWARRFWRIAPLFYLSLLLTALLTHGNPQFAPSQMAHNPFTWASLLAHLSFLFAWIPAFQNSWIGVGWSIGTEMSFYALFPWLVTRVLPRLRPEGLLVVGIALVWLWPRMAVHIPMTHWPAWTGAFLLWSLPRQFIWFAIGLWIWKRRNLWQPKRSWWAILWLALVIPIANTVWTNPQTELLVWLLPLGLLVWLVSHNVPAFRLIAQSRVFAYVGTRSYSLYLLHWILLQAILVRYVPGMHQPGTWGLVLRLAVLLPLSLGLSIVSYHYIEKPGMTYGKQWIHRHVPIHSQPGASTLDASNNPGKNVIRR